MKRIFVIILSAALLLGSFSFTFAADANWSTTDSQNLSYSASRLLSIVNGLGFSSSNTLNTTLQQIMNYLRFTRSGTTYGLASLTNDILNWMQPIYNSLNHTTAGYNIVQELDFIRNGVNNTYNKLFSQTFGYKTFSSTNQGFSSLTNSALMVDYYNADNAIQKTGLDIQNEIFNNLFNYTKGYNFTYRNWLTGDQLTMNPYGFGNGIYRWLQYMQDPIARLGFVFANDDQIAAREAAADNEAAVVDQFIDPSGAGSASTSDIGSISSASNGFKTNFSTDASASGIWSIFDSSNGNWFSQEIASSLDTSSGTNRSLKYSAPLMTSGSAIKTRTYNYDYETPALDKQVNDIMSIILGGDKK